MEDTLTPVLTPKPVVKAMTFYDALKKLASGSKITRESWKNNDYCLMKDGFLSIFREGTFYTWSVNDGDVEGVDWITK
jgi:hypothetical protein